MREYEVLYETIEEARVNIRDIIELLLTSYRENAFQQASPHVVREVVTIAKLHL